MKEAKLVTVASHDTASAVLAVPAAEKENFIYISSGTWSVIGIETREPVINEKGFLGNFTNEGRIWKNDPLLQKPDRNVADTGMYAVLEGTGTNDHL